MTLAGAAGSGVHPAIFRAHFRALAMSLMPENRRRSSMAAESSPCSLKMARIAAAASSETTNMAGSMVTLAAAGKPIAG
jgi:hypothetical protein